MTSVQLEPGSIQRLFVAPPVERERALGSLLLIDRLSQVDVCATFADRVALCIDQPGGALVNCHAYNAERTSMPIRFFEDFPVGSTVELGSHEFTSNSIIAFAREFDPQPMHTDPERARSSIYGGLIASGWHTASVYMRLLVDGVLTTAESLGSPGVEALRWLRPVRPGDVLRARITVLEARPSGSRPQWGIVRSRGEMLNQNDELVLQLEATNFFARRDMSS